MVEFFLLVILLSLIILTYLLSRLWSLRHVAGATELFLCSLAGGLWSLGYAFEILSPSLSYKLFWAKFEYLGIGTITAWFFLFILRFSGYAAWFKIRQIFLLLVIPIVTIIFTFTNEIHGWVWSYISEQPGWQLAPLSFEHGWWFWVQISYSYLLLLGGTTLLLRYVFRIQRHYISQPLIMLIGTLAPWIGNALYLIGLRPGPNLDLTPLAFTFTNIGLVLGFLRFRLLDLLPIAYSSIFKYMSEGVIVVDTHHRIIDMNPAARNIFHRPDLSPPTQPLIHKSAEYDLMIGHRMNDLLPNWAPSPGSEILQIEEELRISKGPGNVERFFSLRTTSIVNQRQQITGYVLIFSDITKIKRAEEQMRLQVTALETAENGIVITNPQGMIEWANPAFTRLTGYSLNEVVENNPRVLKSGRHPDEFYKSLWETITSGNVWRGEMINRRKDGSLYYEEMTITPLVQPDGSIAHYIAIKQDVSERKRAEEQLKIAHEEALESNRLKTQLLANVSHDMRTPLGAIIGFSEILSSGVFGELTTRQKNAVSDIQDSANQLLIFVNNLIGQAQFETGKILLKPRRFQAGELIEACKASVNLPASRKGLQMVYQIDPALPSALYGDLYWLRQVAINLVNNAVKFTDVGSVTLRLWVPDQDHWAIEVSDTGLGISKETLSTIFEPFKQVDGAAVRERGGSGLGLAIVKELTSLMNGQVSLVSQPGVGSTFTVCFPIVSKDCVP